MAISEAERQRRSERAKEMHRLGILGSAAHQKRAAARAAEVRSARASSIARRLLEEHEEEVRRTLLEIIAKGTRSERLKAIDIMVKAGLRGESVDLTERRAEHEAKSREELLALLASKLTNGPTGPLLARHLAEQYRVVPVIEAVPALESEHMRRQQQHGEIIDGQAEELRPRA